MMRVVAFGLAMLAMPATADERQDAVANLAVTTLPPTELARRGIIAVSLGDLPLPTGRIVAESPVSPRDLRPLAISVAPGTYPVTVYYDAEEHFGAALGKLQIATCTPVVWQLAIKDGDSPDMFDRQESGTLGFADQEFYEGYEQRTNGAFAGPEYKQVIASVEAVLRAVPQTQARGAIEMFRNSGVAYFFIGFNRPSRGSYWGVDDVGCVCALVTDFGIFDQGLPYASRLPAPPVSQRLMNEPGNARTCAKTTS